MKQPTKDFISVEHKLPEKEGKYLTDRGIRYFKKDWIYDFDLIDKEVKFWVNNKLNEQGK